LNLDDRNYAIRYATIYTLLIAVVMMAPLYVYFVYMERANEITTQLNLEQQSYDVIRAIEAYDPKSSDYFQFPRYEMYQAGLYDRRFEPIFTLITHELTTFQVGFNEADSMMYLVTSLPSERYFDAEYLVVATPYSKAALFQTVLLILLSVMVILFGFSFFFLRNFALPFKRVNARLDNFIKDSMHEINTPLAIINVNIDLFSRKYEENKYLSRIKAAAKTLATIYNDMDYLIKKDRLEYRDEKIHLASFIQERVDYFSEVGMLRKISLHTELNEGVYFYFNPIKLQRIIDNNLSNAIKYSYERGRVDIVLTIHEQNVALSFIDYGVGIESPHKIFSRYCRENEEKGGFGIGLNIVKNIIDEGGITLSIDSKPKEGSCFQYQFPKSRIHYHIS